MKREIKFRAWVVNNIIAEMHYSKDIQMNSADAISFWHAVGFKNVYPEIRKVEDWQKNITWMQFTGIKDKNGKEIYEGDIYLHYGQVRVVEWEVFDNHQGYSIDTDDLDIEIIGNIYENKNLI